MDVEDVLTRLAAASGGYHRGSARATEPSALAALALLAHGRDQGARPLVDWLADLQSADGSVGIDAAQPNPSWPIGWAVLAWHAAQSSSLAGEKYARAIELAVGWILRVEGSRIEYLDRRGHDTTIIGWPWVEGTHSWVEPTAINLLALVHVGRSEHPRAREAVRLLEDRLLPSGGCNYGNTIVFGQELRPHLQATGLCLVALADQADRSGRVAKSIEYLRRDLPETTATASLCYALLGLAAHGQVPNEADHWLAAAAGRTLAGDASSYKLALVALAALGKSCPMIPANERALESTTP
jgi:hypothetical protein